MDTSSFHQLLLVSAIAFLTPILAARLPGRVLPTVVIEILAGAVFGKSGFDVIQPTQILEFLAAFGFAYLMFLSGLEIDVSTLLSSGASSGGRLRTLVTSPLGAALAVFLGTLAISSASVGLLCILGIAPDFWLTTLMLSTTSVGLVLPTLKGRGLLSGVYGQTLMACAIVADFITLMLIGVFAAAKRDGLSLELAFVLVLPAAFLIAWRVGASLNRYRVVARTLQELSEATSQLQVRGALALMLTFVVLAETTGSELILGAFVAGAIVSLFSPSEGASIRLKLDAIGYGLFIPIFFVNVGVDLDIGAVGHSANDILLLPAFLAIVYAAKLLPTQLLRLRYSGRETLSAGFLLSAPLSLIIAAALIGQELGIITPGVYAVVVLVAIVTATLSPAVFSLLTPARSNGMPYVVVAGAGRTGRVVAARLESNGAHVVLIDHDASLVEGLLDHGLRIIRGEFGNPSALHEAGIERATCFVAVTANDDLNLEACRCVRENFSVPSLVARLNDPANADWFRSEGVRAVSVPQATSSSLVNAVLRPNLFEMMLDEPRGYEIIEVRLQNRMLADQTLREVRLPGNTLVMLLRREGEIVVPKGATMLKAGDVLTIAGDTDSVRDTAEMLSTPY